MKITITLNTEPAVERIYEYKEDTDFNEVIKDIIDSYQNLKE